MTVEMRHALNRFYIITYLLFYVFLFQRTLRFLELLFIFNLLTSVYSINFIECVYFFKCKLVK